MTRRLYATLSVEHRLIGCALLRIALGAVALYYLLGHWTQRELLWGPHGLYPLWLFQRERAVSHAPSLFAVASPLAFQGLYAIAILCSALYLVGWRTRWVQWPFAVLFWSVLTRNPFMLTGGDNLVQVVLPFVMLIDTAAVLSIDAHRREQRQQTRPSRPLAALLHNFALGCTIVQVCIMYCASGLAKVMGHPWQHGTAIYYILRTQEFGLPPFNELVFRSATLVTLLTYGVMAFEIGFPALIIARSTRWLATLGAVLLHLGIGVIMGLVPFATEALMFQFVLYDDESYAPFRRAISARGRRGAAIAAMVVLVGGGSALAQAPPEMGQRFAEIEGSTGGRLGVAALRVEDGRRISYNGGRLFPMASVRKLPIAMTLLARVDAGDDRLDRRITVEPADVLASDGTPLALRLRGGSVATARALLELMLMYSDNTAAATLQRTAASATQTEERLHTLGIAAIHVDRDASALLRDTVMAQRVPPPRRAEALARLEGDSRDAAQPDAVADLLVLLAQRRALSPASTETLIDIMRHCDTGARRLRAGLPSQVDLAHKTGTLARTTNDVGLATFPDGTHVALAVFVTASPKPVPLREDAIAAAARVIYEQLGSSAR